MGERIVQDKRLRTSMSNGESLITKVGECVLFTCCDCGLTHDIWPSYDPQARMVSLLMKRNDNETKKARGEND